MASSSGDPNDPLVVLGFVSAWLLFGAIAMLMTIFYLVNYPDTDIRKATWVTLSNTCSLFSAILIYQAVDNIVKSGIPSPPGDAQNDGNSTQAEKLLHISFCNEASSPPDVLSIIISFLELSFFYVIVQIAMYVQRRRDKLMAAWGMIGAHAIGFATLSAFYSLMVIPPFDETGYHGLMVFLICCSCMFALTQLGRFVRSFARDDEFSKAWHDHCVRAEDEFTSFALGFLISMVVRDLLTGCLHGVHWDPKDTGSFNQTHYLLAIAIGFGVLVAAATQVKRLSMDDDEDNRNRVERLADVFALTMSMTMGWSLLFWGQWAFWLWTGGQGFTGRGNLMVCSLEVVMCFTFGSFFVLIIVDLVADRWAAMEESLRELSEAFVLLLGLSWEGCFMRAFHGIQPQDSNTGKGIALFFVAVVVLCALVIPAWVLFILPNALHYEQEHRVSVRDHLGSEASDGHRSEGEPAEESQVDSSATTQFTWADLEKPDVRLAILTYWSQRGFGVWTDSTSASTETAGPDKVPVGVLFSDLGGLALKHVGLGEETELRDADCTASVRAANTKCIDLRMPSEVEIII